MIKNIKALALGYIYFRVEIEIGDHYRDVKYFPTYEMANLFVSLREDRPFMYINFTGYNPLKTFYERLIGGTWAVDHWYAFFTKFPSSKILYANSVITDDSELDDAL